MGVLFLKTDCKTYPSPEHFIYQLQADPYGHITIIQGYSVHQLGWITKMKAANANTVWHSRERNSRLGSGRLPSYLSILVKPCWTQVGVTHPSSLHHSLQVFWH